MLRIPRVQLQDLDTEDGFPVDVAAKASALVASPKFEAMVSCLASQIVEGIGNDKTVTPLTSQFSARSGPRPLPSPAVGVAGTTKGVSVYLASDAGIVREPLAKRLKAAIEQLAPGWTVGRGSETGCGWVCSFQRNFPIALIRFLHL